MGDLTTADLNVLSGAGAWIEQWDLADSNPDRNNPDADNPLEALIAAARLQVALDELPLLPPCPDDEDRSTFEPRPHMWTVKTITSPWMNGTPNWIVFAVCKGSHKGWAPQVKGTAPTMLAAVLNLGDALRSRT